MDLAKSARWKHLGGHPHRGHRVGMVSAESCRVGGALNEDTQERGAERRGQATEGTATGRSRGAEEGNHAYTGIQVDSLTVVNSDDWQTRFIVRHNGNTDKLMEWTHAVDRTEEWAKHSFRDQNKMADTWANGGRGGLKGGWKDG